ncbi:membrane protein [Klebsiella pneumoniae]|nr:membrane protein [Klebsiella pneumoniae]
MFDLHTISFLLIFIAAGLVKGVTGMGLPTVAMGLLGLLMPPQAAAALLVLPSLLTNLWQLLAGPALAQIVRRLWLMMTGIIIGTLAGSSLLIGLNPRWSALALGAALIVYAGYALCSPVFQVSGRVEKWLSPLMGGLTGVITGGDRGICYSGRSLATGAGLSSRRAGAGPGVVVHPFHPGVGGWPRPARWLA